VPQGHFSQTLPTEPVDALRQHTSLRAFIPAPSQLTAYVPLWWGCQGVPGHPQGPWLPLRCHAVGAPFPGLRPGCMLPLCSGRSPAGRQRGSRSGFGTGVCTERRGRGVPAQTTQPRRGPAIGLSTSTGPGAGAADPAPCQCLGQGFRRGSASRNRPCSCCLHFSRQQRPGHPSSLWNASWTQAKDKPGQCPQRAPFPHPSHQQNPVKGPSPAACLPLRASTTSEVPPRAVSPLG